MKYVMTQAHRNFTSFKGYHCGLDPQSPHSIGLRIAGQARNDSRLRGKYE